MKLTRSEKPSIGLVNYSGGEIGYREAGLHGQYFLVLSKALRIGHESSKGVVTPAKGNTPRTHARLTGQGKPRRREGGSKVTGLG